MARAISPRIFVIPARKARKAVIFRRGPSKQVLLIGWNLANDKLDYGQWFKGRIYERRCDLSPSGDYLIYFAAKHQRALATWTAISKPPFLSALAFWPKGDSWGGGGIFESETSVLLNHRPGEAALAPDFRLKESMRVQLFGSYPGRGEDFPIYHARLLRSGWKLTDEGDDGSRSMIYEKADKGGRRLQMLIKEIGARKKDVEARNGAFYSIDHTVLDESGDELISLPNSDWADWDGGDLLFAKDGKLFRLRRKSFAGYVAGNKEAVKLVADLKALTFEEKTPSAKAARW